MPHKSRACRLILGLSFSAQAGKKIQTSVSEVSSLEDPREALDYAGTILTRSNRAAETEVTGVPHLLTKVDMKEDFSEFSQKKKNDGTSCAILRNSTVVEVHMQWFLVLRKLDRSKALSRFAQANK